jgi:DNA segregation ATPase FtsK/SpoIIIE-like protein
VKSTTLTIQASDAARQRLATELFRGLRHSLLNRGLCQARKDGTLREVPFAFWTYLPELRAIAFVVDTQRLPIAVEKLVAPWVTHHVSTVLGGRRVNVVNHRGLAWFVGIDLPDLDEETRRRLPRRVELNLSQRPAGEYMVGIGVDRGGSLWLSLDKACHIMVGGSSGSGKSAFLRSLLYQLMVTSEPVEVVLADMEGRTFSVFENLARIRFPVAETIQDATQLTAWLMDEMERRGRMFDAYAGEYHPEKLAEYHEALRAKHGTVPQELHLPRIVAVFDEFTALLDAAGKGSTLYHHIGQVAMRARKYGIHLVMSGQDFKSNLIDSRITNQAKTRLAFRCANRHQSESIIGTGQAKDLSVPGRALLSLYGSVQYNQTFWVPKDWVIALHNQASDAAEKNVGLLTGLEQEMVHCAMQELGGEFKITALAQVYKGRISTSKLIALARAWEQRGWLTELKQRNKPRRVTEDLLAAAGIDLNSQGPPRA